MCKQSLLMQTGRASPSHLASLIKAIPVKKSKCQKQHLASPNDKSSLVSVTQTTALRGR